MTTGILYFRYYFGLGLPHSEQNFPAFSAPQVGHFHFPTGLGLPHSQQKFAVSLFSYPQVHFHVTAAGAEVFSGSGVLPA